MGYLCDICVFFLSVLATLDAHTSCDKRETYSHVVVVTLRIHVILPHHHCGPHWHSHWRYSHCHRDIAWTSCIFVATWGWLHHDMVLYDMQLLVFRDGNLQAFQNWGYDHIYILYRYDVCNITCKTTIIHLLVTQMRLSWTTYWGRQLHSSCRGLFTWTKGPPRNHGGTVA